MVYVYNLGSICDVSYWWALQFCFLVPLFIEKEKLM